MRTEEACELFFIPLARREADHCLIEVILRDNDLHVVHRQKPESSLQGGSFVSVVEGMILGQMKRICRRDVQEISLGSVKINVLGLYQRRCQQTFIAHSGSAAEERKLLAVISQDLFLAQKERLVHC